MVTVITGSRGVGLGTPGSGGGNDPNEPVYTAGTDTLLVTEGFEGFTNAQAVFDQRNTGDRVRVYGGTGAVEGQPGEVCDGTLVAGRSGGQAYRLAFAGIDQEIHRLDTWGGTFGSNPNCQMIVTFWCRVIMQTPLPSFGELPLKYVMMFHADGSRIQFNTHNHLPNGNLWPNYFFAVDGKQTGGVLWEVIEGGQDTGNGMQPVPPFAVDVFNTSAWFKVTCQYQPQSALGATDGIARMWINGIKIIDISAATVDITPLGSATRDGLPPFVLPGVLPWCNATGLNSIGRKDDGSGVYNDVTSIRWYANLTDGAGGPFTVDTDDIQVFTRARA